MAVISGVLKGPMGDARVGVVIELRAVKTSATVVNQARSQSVTNATGHYTLNVEPGAYDVMITAGGRQPERVGAIEVMTNSHSGTLNDFLNIPEVTDLNPEIVATVDRMRADAAASAAVAKISETNAKAVTGVLNSSPGGATAAVVWKRIGKITNFGQGGKTLVITIGGTAQYSGHPVHNAINQIVVRTGSGGSAGVNQVGRASISAFLTHGASVTSDSQLIKDIGLIETSANTYEVYIRYNPFVGDISASISGISMSDLISNWTWDRTIVSDPAIVLERDVIKVWTEGNLPNPLKVGDYGIGTASPATLSDADTLGVNQFIRFPVNTPHSPEGTAAWGGISAGYDTVSRFQLVAQMGVTTPNVHIRLSKPGPAFGDWHKLSLNKQPALIPLPFVHSSTTTGYLKIAEASPTDNGSNSYLFAVTNGKGYGTNGLDYKLVYFSTRQATTNSLALNAFQVLSTSGFSNAGVNITFGAIYNSTSGKWELWMRGPSYNIPSIQLLGCPDSATLQGVTYDKEQYWSSVAPSGFTAAPEIVNYTGFNTTVDANGFIKKASPIVKLFGDGNSELNDQSQGVTTERISEGVYRISGTLGFNADAEWGGVDGGIEIPTDRNKLPLVWVDYEVDETGDLLIKTFHRINATAPKFAQNVKAGYEEGQPIDIPVGRWIDLRVEMPGVEEPEFIPEPEPEVVPDSGEESATE